MKRKLVGIFSACLALSLGGAVLAACAPTEPEVTEGAIYVTEAKSFWAGVGSGYLSFEYKEEPGTPAEGERYGYVFHVMVDSGDGYSSYMSGNWELEETEGNYGTLSLIVADGRQVHDRRLYSERRRARLCARPCRRQSRGRRNARTRKTVY